MHLGDNQAQDQPLTIERCWSPADIAELFSRGYPPTLDFAQELAMVATGKWCPLEEASCSRTQRRMGVWRAGSTSFGGFGMPAAVVRPSQFDSVRPALMDPLFVSSRK